MSYLNAKPLLYGIKRAEELKEQIELIEDYPANIAAMLIEGTIDVGLVPVAVIPKLKEWHIITDWCIGAEAEVASVCLFSEVPIDQIKTVILDYQSRTSVNLCKVLLKHHWKIHPEIENATGEDYRNRIKGSTAGVVIGDRALEQRLVSHYIYDLATAWQEMTGLPFMFAGWIANKKLPQSFIKIFNEANAIGIDKMAEVVSENPYPHYDLKKYYTENIDYRLTGEKKKGMELFLSLLPA